MMNGNGQHAPSADEIPEADRLAVAGAVTGNSTLLQNQTTIRKHRAVSPSVEEPELAQTSAHLGCRC